MEKLTNGTPKSNLKTISHLLNSTKLDKVFDIIRREATDGKENVTSYVKALFVGCPSTDELNIKRRFEIYKFCISLLEVRNLDNEVITELLSLLLVETDTFPTSSLMKIAEYLVSEFRKSVKPEGKWLEIISRVLSTLSVRDTIVYQGLDTSGSDLKNLMVKSLCEDGLNRHALMMLTVILKDVNLTKEEVELVVTKLLAILSQVSYQEMPTFMHQFLLFSSKGQRKKILQGIIAHFISEDNRQRTSNFESDEVVESSETLTSRQTEGTVILLLKVNARQDRGLGKDMVAMIKSLQFNPLICLSPFVFSIALSLAGVQRYEEEVLDILKAVVLRAFKQKEKACFSAWIRDILSIEQDVASFIKEAINNSKHGWDHVGQGLVKFGFLLLDSFGPKLVCGKIPNKSKPHTLTVSEHICTLGRIILRNTFKVHRSVRSEVFEQIISRVITKTSSPVSHYIDVLSQTVRSDPQLLLEILSKLIEVLDYLPLLPYENAVNILKALTPLLKISMPLKDALMLILRKALFHRNLEARKIAITGYVTILKKINTVSKLSLSQSQSTMSSQGSSSSSMGSQMFGNNADGPTKSESMCLEIMGILKRILMQQAELKQLLYESLYDAVVKNSSLSDIILELLLSQFEKFHNTADDCTFHLNIAVCVKLEKEKVLLNEPLAHLICAISLILYEIKGHPNNNELDLEFDQSPQVMLQELLNNLVIKISKSEVDCPELDELEQYEEGTIDNKSKEIIVLLMNVYEVLIEYSFLNNMDNTVEGYEELLLIFKKFQKLSEKLQSTKMSKTSKAKQNNTLLPDSILTMRFCGVIIEKLFSDADDEGLKLLRSNNDFVKYILSTCNSKLAAYNEQGKSDGFSSNMERTYDYMCTIAKFYLSIYSNGLKPSFGSFQTWELSSLFIKGLSVLFSFMFSVNEQTSHKLISMLAKHIPSTSDDGYTRVLKKFQKLTIKALADPENEEKLKEVIALLSIITDICTVPSVHKKEEVYLWVKQLSIEQTFDDLPLVKKLVSLCLTLSHQQKDDTNVLREISSDIHHYLGDIETSATSDQTHFNVVTTKTSPELILVIVHHIEKILDEIDWVLNIMKADSLLINTAIQETLVKQTDSFHIKEGNICLLLLDLIKVFNELVQTEIPVGNLSNTLLKVTITFYKCLTVLCKYYLARYDQKTGYLHPLFQKMVKFSGSHLTTPVYGFITYIQAKENETVVTKKRSKSEAAVKVIREIKTIPPLVFAIELYERHLIMLSKKSKKNLMSHMKLSTARDFRIEASTAEAAMNHQEEDSNHEASEIETTVCDNENDVSVVPETTECDNENDVSAVPETPPPKKRRISKKSKNSKS